MWRRRVTKWGDMFGVGADGERCEPDVAHLLAMAQAEAEYAADGMA